RSMLKPSTTCRLIEFTSFASVRMSITSRPSKAGLGTLDRSTADAPPAVRARIPRAADKAARWDERVRVFSIFVTFPYPPRDAASSHVGLVGLASTAVAENDSSSELKLSPLTTMRLYTPDRLEEVFARTRLEPTLTCHTGGESRLG